MTKHPELGIFVRTLYQNIFSLLETVLSDRDIEFGDPESLETGIHEIQLTSIYYCDPMRSCQRINIVLNFNRQSSS